MRKVYRTFLMAALTLPVVCTPPSPTPDGTDCPRGGDYQYRSTDMAKCAKMPVCEKGVPFRNRCGCGCKIATKEAQSSAIPCNDSQRTVDYCVEVYAPVCGWFLARPAECSNRYCRETYANSCFACKDARVKAYTTGGCDAGGQYPM